MGPLDGPSDTSLEIVVPTSGGQVYVVNSNGTTRSPFPISIPLGGTTKTPSPALADMNNDGYLDIVQAGTNGGIYVFQRTGFLVIPWLNIRYAPSTTGASESSPVVADITGDGLPDVVMGGEDKLIAAIGNNGVMLPGFPLVVSSEVRGTPAVCDCDGDGMTEIVMAGWDGMMNVWDYDFPFSPGHVPPWPQFHHDARRTGLSTSLAFVGVGDPPGGEAPARVEFAPPSPNPTRIATHFEFAIPADRAGQTLELSLFDVHGRRVTTLLRGPVEAGRRKLTWDLRDGDGSPARTGIYFARLQVGAEVWSHKFVVVR